MTEPRDGFVIAASGANYMPMAFNAGASLRAVHPDVPIDLYTDQAADPGPFDRVVALKRSWHRPKLEALRETRFERTVYLDTDTYVLAELTDLFTLLDKFDIVGAHNDKRGNELSNRPWTRPLPQAFPQINSGVLGVRRSEGTRRLLQDVEDALASPDVSRDQVPLRELLYDSDLRLGVLPIEYNLMALNQISVLRPGKNAAPRVLHIQRFHRHLRMDIDQTSDLGRVLGYERLARLDRLMRQDLTLEGVRTADLSPWRKGWRARFADLRLRLS